MTEEERLKRFESDRKILNNWLRSRYQDHLRWKKSGQGKFETSFLHLDHPIAYGLRILEPSDHGKAAAEIRAAAEEPAPPPRWRGLWRKAARKLTKKQRKILRALLVDYRTNAAAKLSGQNRKLVQRCKQAYFKKLFGPCYAAWRKR